jgi:hypothetical protein
MARPSPTIVAALFPCMLVLSLGAVSANETDDIAIRESFRTEVRPFLKTYCLNCHGADKREAKLDLSGYTTVNSVTRDLRHWETVLQRLVADEMPPEDAKVRPSTKQRLAMIDWIYRLRRREAVRNAGDPGLVLARRLNNAEYDYTIHDLTGVDIRPTRLFPVDPANEAGFANSGESLAMSPALLTKYLDAARLVVDHLVLTPTGLNFAPFPVITDSDRDKYCVHRIVDFYKRQPVDYADYFFAAWQYKHREQLQKPNRSLTDIARAEQVSPKYLATVWEVLTDGKNDAGPLAALRQMWEQVSAADEGGPIEARDRCVKMREFVTRQREQLIIPLDKSSTAELKETLQPTIIWINRKKAANRRNGRLPRSDGTPQAEQQIEAVARFCSVFPDAFFISERGRTFLDPKDRNEGRLLSAGFHLMVGYFRDDAPLYNMILDDRERRELDSLWSELDFVTRAPMRQFRDFIYFERAESTRYLTAPEFDFARSEDNDITSPQKLGQVARLFLAKAKESGISASGIAVLDFYFNDISAHIRRVEKDLARANQRHLDAVLRFAETAWRRPLTPEDRRELRLFYASLTERDELRHEDAIRDMVVTVLMSPRFGYRVDPAPPGKKVRQLSDVALASRLSYFLWSSMPDTELLAHAAANDLHDPDVLIGQTRRMLADPRIRRLAVEFGGNWLDFRQFQQHNAVDRSRFESFTDDLRQAMFEEPVRFFVDLVHRDASVIEFLGAEHTFVNPILAAHYGIETPDLPADQWMRVDDARRYGRGGLLSMSVFLTKNSPGLRTSPVKRGYWVVRRVLGEHIPAPPADVPELPEDESKTGDLSIRQMLARHRKIKSCAACHNRFDSIGLVFEGYGPIGERREADLGGRPIDVHTQFPDGSQGNGPNGLRRYLQNERQDEFVDNLCRKLLAYGLSRSLILSDDLTIDTMISNLEKNDYRFGQMVEAIVSSPQFLNRRGQEFDMNED